MKLFFFFFFLGGAYHKYPEWFYCPTEILFFYFRKMYFIYQSVAPNIFHVKLGLQTTFELKENIQFIFQFPYQQKMYFSLTWWVFDQTVIEEEVLFLFFSIWNHFEDVEALRTPYVCMYVCMYVTFYMNYIYCVYIIFTNTSTGKHTHTRACR